MWFISRDSSIKAVLLGFFAAAWLTGGCSAGEADSLDPGGAVEAAPPPWSTQLDVTADLWAERGERFPVRISGGPPSETVYVVFTDGDIGLGDCPPVLNGQCLSMRPGAGYLIEPVVLDLVGRAVARPRLPPGFAGDSVHIQVVAPSADGASPVTASRVVPPGCTLTGMYPDCGPLPAPPYDLAWMFASVSFAYEPVVDAAVSWEESWAPGVALMPALTLSLLQDRGQAQVPMPGCQVRIVATQDVPRAAWSPAAGNRRFGFELDPRTNARVTESCTPDTDPNAVQAALANLITCQSWGIEVLGRPDRPTMDNVIGALGNPSEVTTIRVRYADTCGQPPTWRSFYGTALEATQAMVVDPTSAPLTGPGRWAIGVGGVQVPTRSLWNGTMLAYEPL